MSFVDLLGRVELVLDGLVALDVGLGHRVEHAQPPALGLPVFGALDAQLDEHDAAVLGLLVAEPQLPRRLPQPPHLVWVAIDARARALSDTYARSRVRKQQTLTCWWRSISSVLWVSSAVTNHKSQSPSRSCCSPIGRARKRAVGLEADEHRRVELVEEREQLLLGALRLLWSLLPWRRR